MRRINAQILMLCVSIRNILEGDSVETYHKINAPFKRYTEGEKKGRLILGQWSVPEFEYLAENEWEFTEKVDGTNIRILLSRVDAKLVCVHRGRSDNAVIPPGLQEHLNTYFPRSVHDTPRHPMPNP